MSLVSAKLRASAQGRECSLRLPGICNHDPKTTVLAHLPSRIGLKGIGTKVPDYWAVFSCSACHYALDAQRLSVSSFMCVEALERTWAIWFEEGLIRVAGDNDKPKEVKVPKVMARKPLYSQR